MLEWEFVFNAEKLDEEEFLRAAHWGHSEIIESVRVHLWPHWLQVKWNLPAQLEHCEMGELSFQVRPQLSQVKLYSMPPNGRLPRPEPNRLPVPSSCPLLLAPFPKGENRDWLLLAASC